MNDETHKAVDSIQIIADLDAGLFAAKISDAMTQAGRAAIVTQKPATVTIELRYVPITNTNQVWVKHKLKSVTPHLTGQLTDEDTKQTPVYIHPKGDQSITPFDQTELKFETD